MFNFDLQNNNLIKGVSQHNTGECGQSEVTSRGALTLLSAREVVLYQERLGGCLADWLANCPLGNSFLIC